MKRNASLRASEAECLSAVREIIVAMDEHKWAPPEHPDVTLHQPVGIDPELAGELTPIEPPRPVFADIAFVTIPDPLHLPCFAIAASDVAVLVETAWQGRRQEVLVDRDHVFHRTLRPRR